jgi:beta-glucosidase
VPTRRQVLAGGAGLAGGSLLGMRGAEAGVPVRPLPRGFRWGVSTSGFQSEGHAPDSNWSRYVAAGTHSIKDPYGDAVDFLHRYGEDIALAAGLGISTFRMGLEWARVQPAPGVWSADGLSFYDGVIDALLAAGLTPMVTLVHTVHPGWVVDGGGWPAARTIGDYLAFVQGIVTRYRGKGIIWLTFNECFPYLQLELLNGGITLGQVPAMAANLVTAHRQAYDLIHALDPGAPVSSNVAYYPGLYAVGDALFLDQVGDKLDFLALDYYYGGSLTDQTALHQLTDQKVWLIRPEPEDLYWALRYYQQRFPRLPLYITENGMATENGQPRPDGYTRTAHLNDHLYWLQRARADGVNVVGYHYWGLTDSYEWGWYTPRFGLYTVDVRSDPSLARRPTDGVAAYRAAIARGGVPAGYTPTVRATPGSVADLSESFLATLLGR